MCTNDALDALDAAVAALSVADARALNAADRLRALDCLETARRRQVAVFHTIVKSLNDDGPPLLPANQKTRQRPHPMDPPTPTPTTPPTTATSRHQQLSPPRTTPTQPGQRRRINLE